jgi:hypothetical protein
MNVEEALALRFKYPWVAESKVAFKPVPKDMKGGEFSHPQVDEDDEPIDDMKRSRETRDEERVRHAKMFSEIKVDWWISLMDYTHSSNGREEWCCVDSVRHEGRLITTWGGQGEKWCFTYDPEKRRWYQSKPDFSEIEGYELDLEWRPPVQQLDK